MANVSVRAPLESDVKAGITKALRTCGAQVWDTSQPHRAMITPGVPDLLVFLGPRFTFAEVKRPGGALSAGQRQFMEACRVACVPHRVWSSTEDAIRWVQER